mmetsp:Transcript_120945/g.293496  ORF Transcript_120945/g.293496 Transcript_120945/m.293496 type:complete len:205 (-) Transcript_120945:860-1474(-)
MVGRAFFLHCHRDWRGRGRCCRRRQRYTRGHRGTVSWASPMLLQQTAHIRVGFPLDAFNHGRDVALVVILTRTCCIDRTLAANACRPGFRSMRCTTRQVATFLLLAVRVGLLGGFFDELLLGIASFHSFKLGTQACDFGYHSIVSAPGQRRRRRRRRPRTRPLQASATMAIRSHGGPHALGTAGRVLGATSLAVVRRATQRTNH